MGQEFFIVLVLAVSGVGSDVHSLSYDDALLWGSLFILYVVLVLGFTFWESAVMLTPFLIDYKQLKIYESRID